MGYWKGISFKHGDYNLKILGVFYQKTYGVFPKTYGEFFKTRRVFCQQADSSCQIQWQIYHVVLLFVFLRRESYCEFRLFFPAVALKTCRSYVSARLAFNRNYTHFILQKKIHFVIFTAPRNSSKSIG